MSARGRQGGSVVSVTDGSPVGAYPVRNVLRSCGSDCVRCALGWSKSRAFVRLRRASYFLSLAREKVTKERGTPLGAFRPLHGRKVREPGAGFSTAHPCAGEKASASCRCPLTRPVAPDSPPHRGWKSSEPAARTRCAAAKRLQKLGARSGSAFDLAFRRVRAGCALLFPGPLCGGEAWPAGPQGNRQEADSFSPAHGCAVEKPGHASCTFRAGGPESAKRGGLSFGYFSLATQRKVTRAPKAHESFYPKPKKSIAIEGAPTGQRRSRTRCGPTGMRSNSRAAGARKLLLCSIRKTPRPGAASVPPGVGPRHGARS